MAAKDLYEKDLYAILGVKKSDSQDAIKKQYRKLARELHPDKTKGDKKLEDRFKDVSEAYEVLSDDKKKAEYDEMRDAFKDQTRGLIDGGSDLLLVETQIDTLNLRAQRTCNLLNFHIGSLTCGTKSFWHETPRWAVTQVSDSPA